MSPSRAAKGQASKKGAYHHGDLRRALLDATLQLVEEHGPQGFSLRAASRAAGVTPAATYHHFEDKDALLAAVAGEGFKLFRAALESAAKKPAESARDRSHNVGVAYVLFAVRNPTRFRVMTGYGVVSPEREEMVNDVMASFELVRDTLVEGLRCSPDEVISDAEVLGWWSVVHGLAFLAINGQLGKVGSSAKRSERVVREVINALDARPRP